MAKSKYEELVDSMKAEEAAATETTSPQNTSPAEQPPKEVLPADEPPAETPPASDDKPQDTPPAADKPAGDPKEFAFRRQLGRQREHYEAQIKELTEGFNKEINGLKEALGKLKPEEKVKTRTDFETDDEYIDYLTQRRVNAILAERDANAKKASEEAAAKKKEEDDAAAELQERRNAFNANVDEAFGHDQNRRANFDKRLAFCMERGLGEILDKVPIASNFLMNHPRGPIVFEKILTDKDAFARAFNERMLDPMDIYYELRQIDKELATNAAAQQGNPPPAPAAVRTPAAPHIGRPGKQGGNDAGEPNIWDDSKAMLDFIRGVK